jgi:hypothetical protein
MLLLALYELFFAEYYCKYIQNASENICTLLPCAIAGTVRIQGI